MWTRRDGAAVAAIAALAFAVRAVLASLTAVVATDSPSFLLFAEEMGRGRWDAGLEHGIHPAYPVAIAMAGSVLGLERGAYAVSALFGALAVVPFFAMVRDMTDRRVAVVASLVFACLPYFVMEHADVMSEGLFHFFFVTAVALGWFAATRGWVAGYVLAGMAGALAYMTRPEGVYVPVAVAGVTVLARSWRMIPAAIASCALFVVLAMPLLLYWRHLTGEWKVTWRGSSEAALSTFRESKAPPLGEQAPRNRGAGEAFAQLGKVLVRSTLWFVAPLAALGAYFLRGRIRGLPAAYPACVAAGYLVPAMLAGAHGYAVSRRYLLIPILFVLPFVAIGVVALSEWAQGRWAHGRRAVGVALAVALMAMLVVTVRPRRTDEVGIAEAGRWVRANAPAEAVVYSDSAKVAWYVGRRVKVVAAEPPPGSYVVVTGEGGAGRCVAEFGRVRVYAR